MINAKDRMVDLIHMNHMLVSVINRFGIDLGFGDSNVEEVCEQNKVNTDFFLEIINSYNDEHYFPEKKLQDFSVSLITDYLGKTHSYYLDIKIPEIEKLINRMINESYKNNKHAGLLKSYFRKYKDELLIHIRREDELVFPYSIKTEIAYLSRNKNEKYNLPPEYSIKKYLSEHDDIESKLFDLKNIIIKYLHPSANPSLCSQVISELFRLEKDLNDHSRIEDKVLIPKLMYMENELYNRKNKIIERKTMGKNPGKHKSSVLSKREKNILREVALGLTNKEIANKLFISIHTVTTHRKNITRKIGIKTVSGLTIYSILNGLIKLEEVSDY